MKLFYNSNDAFGEPGPFEAESAEALADEMEETFKDWARSEWENDFATTEGKHQFVPRRVQEMRREFIAGLEER